MRKTPQFTLLFINSFIQNTFLHPSFPTREKVIVAVAEIKVNAEIQWRSVKDASNATHTLKNLAENILKPCFLKKKQYLYD